MPCILLVVVGVSYYFNDGTQSTPTNIAKPEPLIVEEPQTLVLLTKRSKADAFARRIEDIRGSVKNFDVNDHTSELASLDDALKSFDSWADFVGKGIAMNLSADASLKLKTLYESAEIVQQKSLPVLRDQYGPLIRAKFAKINAAKSAMTVGKGFKSLIFTSADFKNKEAVEQFHADNLERFINLRFEKITYRLRRWDENPTVKTIAKTTDKSLIDWTRDADAGAIGQHHIFTASNHRKARKTRTASAE